MTAGSKKVTSISLALLAGGAFPAVIVASGIMRGFQRKTIVIDDEGRPALEGFDDTTRHFPSPDCR